MSPQGDQNPVRGIFLDLDGTLADSMPVYEVAYYRFMESLGLTGSQAEFFDLAGRTLAECMELLRVNGGLDTPASELARRYLGTVRHAYIDSARPTPGSRRLLTAAAQRGIPVAVVTSAPSLLAKGFLDKQGLTPHIAAIICDEDVSQGKPHPEPFLSGCAALGVEPASGLAVEDSQAGLRSALAAGLITYAISLSGGPFPAASGLAGTITRLDQLIARLG